MLFWLFQSKVINMTFMSLTWFYVIYMALHDFSVISITFVSLKIIFMSFTWFYVIHMTLHGFYVVNMALCHEHDFSIINMTFLSDYFSAVDFFIQIYGFIVFKSRFLVISEKLWQTKFYFIFSVDILSLNS